MTLSTWLLGAGPMASTVLEPAGIWVVGWWEGFVGRGREGITRAGRGLCVGHHLG